MARMLCSKRVKIHSRRAGGRVEEVWSDAVSLLGLERVSGRERRVGRGEYEASERGMTRFGGVDEG